MRYGILLEQNCKSYVDTNTEMMDLYVRRCHLECWITRGFVNVRILPLGLLFEVLALNRTASLITYTISPFFFFFFFLKIKMNGSKKKSETVDVSAAPKFKVHCKPN